MTTSSLFGTKRPIVGMVHLLALPEAPAYQGNLDVIYERALREALVFQKAGVDALIVENFGDEPYLPGELTFPQLALMAAVTREIIRTVTIPVGVNCQFNAWQSEIAIAYSTKAEFIRVEVFVDTVLTAQGQLSPCSAQIRRYQQQLGAKSVSLWADVQTKYTVNLIPQSIQQSALDAQASGADMLIVTGSATGQATPLEVVRQVKEVVHIPVVVGSGTTASSVRDVLRIADGAIVGSAFKYGGKAENEVSPEATRTLMAAAREGDR